MRCSVQLWIGHVPQNVSHGCTVCTDQSQERAGRRTTQDHQHHTTEMLLSCFLALLTVISNNCPLFAESSSVCFFFSKHFFQEFDEIASSCSHIPWLSHNSMMLSPLFHSTINSTILLCFISYRGVSQRRIRPQMCSTPLEAVADRNQPCCTLAAGARRLLDGQMTLSRRAHKLDVGGSLLRR